MVTASVEPFPLPAAFGGSTQLAAAIVHVAEGIAYLAPACPESGQDELAIAGWWHAFNAAALLFEDLACLAEWPDGSAAAAALDAHLGIRDDAVADDWWIALDRLAGALADAARTAWPFVIKDADR